MDGDTSINLKYWIECKKCKSLKQRTVAISPHKGWLDIHGRRHRVNTNFFNHLLAYRNESCQHIIRKVKEGIHTEYRNIEQPTTNNSSTSAIPVNHGPVSQCLVIKMPVPTYKRSNQGFKGNAIRELFSVEKLQTSVIFFSFCSFFFLAETFQKLSLPGKNG